MLYTTTITVFRPREGADVDPYVPGDNPVDELVYESIPAHISKPSSSKAPDGSTSSRKSHPMQCAPIELLHTDRVVDDVTGVSYSIDSVMSRVGLGLDHVTAKIKVIEGVAS